MSRLFSSVRARTRTLSLVVAPVVLLAACDTGPKPGQEGAYWGEKLVEASDPAKRDAAMKHLQEEQDKGSLPFLYEVLKQPPSEVRPAVVELIGMIGDDGSVDPVVGSVDLLAGAGHDKESKLRSNTNEKALKALTRLAQKNPAVAQNPRVVEVARKLSSSNSLDVQLAAIYALGELKAKEAVDDLIGIADGHENNYMVKNACEALTKIGDAKAANVMGKLLFFERTGASFYREASWGLFLLGKEAMPTLRSIAEGTFKPIETMHIDPFVQKTKSLVVMGDLFDPSTHDFIVTAATTEGAGTGPALFRIEGMRAASRLGLDKIVPALKKRMDNVDVSQSEHALAALVLLGRKEIASDLWKMTTSDGFMKNCTGQDNEADQCKFNEAQIRGVRLLHWSRVAPGSALGELEKALGVEQNPKVKDAMEKAKSRVQVAKECDGKGVGCWREKLKDENAQVRERAAYELLWTGTDESRDALVDVLTDKDNETRAVAIVAVSRRPPTDGVPLADKLKAQLETERGQAQYIRINEDLKRLEVRLRRGF
jgi:HEAT repeat protein